jgi:glycosyltransferase involved in cell wall biosynthesis
MKLLVMTQKVDRKDPVLGFFHGWLEEFSRQTSALTVLCQNIGEHALPSSIAVHSLGKDTGKSSLFQVRKFLGLLWKKRTEYDAVFVHMTPVWVLIAFPLSLILRKPLFLWYEVRRGGWKLRLAHACVRKVFSATEHGLPFSSKKNVVTGHGIDTDMFSLGTQSREEHLLSTVGRFSRIKRMHLFLECLASLPSSFRLTIAGGAVTADDRTYLQECSELLSRRKLGERVEMRFLAPAQLPSLLRRTTLFLYAAGGGLDKALLEAMACGCPVVSCSEASLSFLPAECKSTVADMPRAVERMLQKSPKEREELGRELRAFVLKNHSLPRLISTLVSRMGS